MLFHFKDGALLSRDRFVSCVGEALKVAGVDCKSYAGHSSQQVWPGPCNDKDTRSVGKFRLSPLSWEELAGVSKVLSQMPSNLQTPQVSKVNGTVCQSRD